MNASELKNVVNKAYEKVSAVALNSIFSCKEKLTRKLKAKSARYKETTRSTVEEYRGKLRTEREDFDIAKEKLMLEKQTLENKLKYLSDCTEIRVDSPTFKKKTVVKPPTGFNTPRSMANTEKFQRKIKKLELKVEALEEEKSRWLITENSPSHIDSDKERMKRIIGVLQGKLVTLVKATRKFMKVNIHSQDIHEEKSKLESIIIEAQSNFDIKLKRIGKLTPNELFCRDMNTVKRGSVDLKQKKTPQLDREKYEKKIKQLSEKVSRVYLGKRELDNKLEVAVNRDARTCAEELMTTAIDEMHVSYKKLILSVTEKEDKITTLFRNYHYIKSEISKTKLLNEKSCREIKGLKNEKQQLEENLTRSYERVVGFSSQFDVVWKQKEEARTTSANEKDELNKKITRLEKELKQTINLLEKCRDDFTGEITDLSDQLNGKIMCETNKISTILKSYTENMTSKQKHIETIQTEANNLQSQLETHRTSQFQIEETLHKRDLAILSLNQTISIQTHEAESLKAELTQLHSSHDQLLAEHMQLNSKLIALTNELAPKPNFLAKNCTQPHSSKYELTTSPDSSSTEKTPRDPRIFELTNQLTLKDTDLQILHSEYRLLANQLQIQTEELATLKTTNEQLVFSKKSTEITLKQLQELLKSEAQSSKTLTSKLEALETELHSYKVATKTAQTTLQGLQEVLGPHFQDNLLCSVRNLVDSLQLYQPNSYFNMNPESFSICTDRGDIPRLVQSDDSSMSNCSPISIPSEIQPEDTSKAKSHREVKSLQRHIKKLERKVTKLSNNEYKGKLQYLSEVIVSFIKLLPKLNEEAENTLKIILTMIEVTGNRFAEIEQERAGKGKNKLLNLFGL